MRKNIHFVFFVGNYGIIKIHLVHLALGRPDNWHGGIIVITACRISI